MFDLDLDCIFYCCFLDLVGEFCYQVTALRVVSVLRRARAKKTLHFQLNRDLCEHPTTPRSHPFLVGSRHRFISSIFTSEIGPMCTEKWAYLSPYMFSKCSLCHPSLCPPISVSQPGLFYKGRNLKPTQFTWQYCSGKFPRRVTAYCEIIHTIRTVSCEKKQAGKRSEYCNQGNYYRPSYEGRYPQSYQLANSRYRTA